MRKECKKVKKRWVVAVWLSSASLKVLFLRRTLAWILINNDEKCKWCQYNHVSITHTHIHTHRLVSHNCPFTWSICTISPTGHYRAPLVQIKHKSSGHYHKTTKGGFGKQAQKDIMKDNQNLAIHIHSMHFLACSFFPPLCYFCPNGDSQLQSHRHHRQCMFERDCVCIQGSGFMWTRQRQSHTECQKQVCCFYV